MSAIVSTPIWFQGIDIILEAFSIIVAAIIAVMGYRVYKLTEEKKSLYLSIAFASITASFIARAVTAGIIVSQVNNAGRATTAVTVEILENVFHAGRVAYLILVLFAYLIILALSMKINDKKILTFIGFLLLLFTINSSTFTFYIAELLFLIFIAWYYRNNYFEKKTSGTKLTSLAFAILILEPLLLIASLWFQPLVAGAYFIRLVAYTILLIMLIKLYTK